MFEFVNPDIEGDALFSILFGDIVDFLTPYTAVLFTFALVFTIFVLIARPEHQVDIAFGGDAYYTKEISVKQMKFQRFMAAACGLAAMGGILSGDLFNFTLFTALIGVCNICIVASVKNKHVLENAYEYGLVAMAGTLPLFTGAAIALASTGTLSMWELFAAGTVPAAAKFFLLIGVIAEGMAPVFVAKAEITRAPGAPYILMVHVSSLLIFLRVIEILISM